ncbi:MAG: endonuclease domain-containing protein [Terriglobia bacterium]
MRGQLSPRIPTPRVRELRRGETEAEKAAWRLLRARRTGLKFHRQHPIGKYVVDFYCFELRLAIELDGSAHSQPSQITRDKAKDSCLRSIGIRVLRLPNGLVLEDSEGFLSRIRAASLSL